MLHFFLSTNFNYILFGLSTSENLYLKISQQATKNNPKKVHAARPMDISTRIVSAKPMCHSVNQYVTEICIVKDMQRGIMGNATQPLHLNAQILKVVDNTIRVTLEPWTWILDADQEGYEIDMMDVISNKEVSCFQPRLLKKRKNIN